LKDAKEDKSRLKRLKDTKEDKSRLERLKANLASATDEAVKMMEREGLSKGDMQYILLYSSRRKISTSSMNVGERLQNGDTGVPFYPTGKSSSSKMSVDRIINGNEMVVWGGKLWIEGVSTADLRPLTDDEKKKMETRQPIPAKSYSAFEAWRQSSSLQGKRIRLPGDAVLKRSALGVTAIFTSPTGRRIAGVGVKNDDAKPLSDIKVGESATLSVILETTVKGIVENQLVLTDAEFLTPESVRAEKEKQKDELEAAEKLKKGIAGTTVELTGVFLVDGTRTYEDGGIKKTIPCLVAVDVTKIKRILDREEVKEFNDARDEYESALDAVNKSKAKRKK
jgi:hypothetical protein